MLTICIILIVLLALDLLFTLALRCRKGHPKWELLKKYRYAHRGFHDKPVIPENSLPAFRRAIEHGFGAELDVHLLKDGTLAVFHDSDLRRCANVDGADRGSDAGGAEAAPARGHGRADPDL